MKKKLSILLAMGMVFSMTTNAFAADTNKETLTGESGKNVASIAVYGEYLTELKSEEILSVDVEWGAMNFTFAASKQGTWDPGTHKYLNSSQEAGWVGDTTSAIKVTNHSNIDVTAAFDFEAEESYTDVTGSFDQSSVDLNAGVVNKREEADNKTVTFTIGGILTEGTAKDTKLGTITVSVDKKTTTGSEDNTEKTVTALTDALTAAGSRTVEFEYNYYDDHDPDWSKLTLVATYDDGNTERITADNSAVTVTYSDKTLAQMRDAEELGICLCTLTYKGCSFNINVKVVNDAPVSGGLPNTAAKWVI